MLDLHSQVSSSELAVVSGLNVASLVVDSIHETRQGWLALVSVTSLVDSPNRVSAKLIRPSVSAKPWWRRIAGRDDKIKQPATRWMMAAEIKPGWWIWLGNVSCHSWSNGPQGEATAADLVLEQRIPRELFMQIRNGEGWIDLGGGLALEGGPEASTAERIKSIKATDKGDVFLERWEGEQFALQFDQHRSVFYFVTLEPEPMPQRFALCGQAAAPPTAPEECLEMHCPCCGIDMGAFRLGVHMTREFGFFVLEWLLDHNELPETWPSSANAAIEWREVDA